MQEKAYQFNPALPDGGLIVPSMERCIYIVAHCPKAAQFCLSVGGLSLPDGDLFLLSQRSHPDWLCFGQQMIKFTISVESLCSALKNDRLRLITTAFHWLSHLVVSVLSHLISSIRGLTENSCLGVKFFGTTEERNTCRSTHLPCCWIKENFLGGTQV